MWQANVALNIFRRSEKLLRIYTANKSSQRKLADNQNARYLVNQVYRFPPMVEDNDTTKSIHEKGREKAQGVAYPINNSNSDTLDDNEYSLST